MFDFAYQAKSSNTHQTHISITHNQVDPNWYPDTVATHHLTSYVNNLTFHADEYMGTCNDDDVGIPFHHIGTFKLLSSFKSFLSNQLLHTPTIEKILVIACKFTQDNNIFFLIS